MPEVRITAEPRNQFGKGFARRTRRAGRVPAVLYGHGEAPRHISLPARELSHAFKAEGGGNVLLRVDLDGSSELALPRQIQRDPLRGNLTHVDLLLVRRGEKVAVDIPVHPVGESPAVRSGDGLLTIELNILHVEAEATHIPQGVDVDISGLHVGDSVHAGDVKLPEGVTLLADPELVVVHVLAAASQEQVEAELAQAEAELGAGQAGAAAAAEAAADDAALASDDASAEEPPADQPGE